MKDVTLILSRDVELHQHYKERFEELGFKNVYVTAAESDGLYMIINELKPNLVFVSFLYYECCTPYMMSQLLKRFPNLNIVAISTTRYPANIAKFFIYFGVKSCIYYQDGVEQFYEGLRCVKEGKIFISKSIKEKVGNYPKLPQPADKLTQREIEIVKLLSNGLKTIEVADLLNISERTVHNHKMKIYSTLNVRNVNELLKAALILGIINENELCFFGKNYDFNRNKEKDKDIKQKNQFSRSNIYDFKNEKW